MKPKFEIGDEVIYCGLLGKHHGTLGVVVGVKFVKERVITKGKIGPGYAYLIDPPFAFFDEIQNPFCIEESIRPKPKDDFKRFMDKALEPVNIEGGLEVLYESQVYTR